MSDRWMPVHGGSTSLTFTIQDLYNSAAVVVANRGASSERVCVSVTARPPAQNSGEAFDPQELLSQFTLLADPFGSGKPQQPSALSTAYAVVPPDATIVVAVVSPRGNTRQLPPGLLVQVFTTSADNSAATVTLSEAETSSREVAEWLNRRRAAAGDAGATP